MVKISGMTLVAAWADADISEVTIVGAPNLTRSVTREDALRREHATILVTDGVTSQSLLTASGWTKITQFGANGPAASIFTPDQANNRITIVPACDGCNVAWNVAFLGVAGVNYDFGIYWNSALQAGGRDERTVPIGSNIERVSASTQIAPTTANLYLELYAKVDADATLAVKQMTLSTHRLA